MRTLYNESRTLDSRWEFLFDRFSYAAWRLSIRKRHVSCVLFSIGTSWYVVYKEWACFARSLLECAIIIIMFEWYPINVNTNHYLLTVPDTTKTIKKKRSYFLCERHRHTIDIHVEIMWLDKNYLWSSAISLALHINKSILGNVKSVLYSWQCT